MQISRVDSLLLALNRVRLIQVLYLILLIITPSLQFSIGKRQARHDTENGRSGRHGPRWLPHSIRYAARSELSEATSVEDEAVTSVGAGPRHWPTSSRHEGKLVSGVYSGDSLAHDTRFPTLDSTSALPASTVQAIRARETNNDNNPASPLRRRPRKDEQTWSRQAAKHSLSAEREEFHGLSRWNLLQTAPGQVSGRAGLGGQQLGFNKEHQSASGDNPADVGQFTKAVKVVLTHSFTSHRRAQSQDYKSGVIGGGSGVFQANAEAPRSGGERHQAHDTWKSFRNRDNTESQSLASGGSGLVTQAYEAPASLQEAADPNAAVQLGHSEALQQEVSHGQLDTHVSKMVLTAVGSLTALAGVCVMAAIFQCCCRKKRRGGGAGGGQQDGGLKTDQKDQAAGDSKRSRSKSPSPNKVPEIHEDKVEDSLLEQANLLEDDPDLGDFSVVQRETEILRSYRKPPPPKNRARASRVPRALKTADPNENPNVFKELVDQEEKELQAKANAKTANGLMSPDKEQPPSMHSSMLADIDCTIAALHDTNDSALAELRQTPSKIPASQFREGSVEKVLSPPVHVSPGAVPSNGGSTQKRVSPEGESNSSQSQPQLRKPNGKDELSRALSREELAKSIAKELSEKSQSKTASPKVQGKDMPKSQSADSPRLQSKDAVKSTSTDEKGPSPKSRSHSAGPSPKLKSKEKDPHTSKSQDNVSGAAENGKSVAGTAVASEGEEMGRTEVQNVFALIDPTVGDKGKSKIPVRASSSPTQPSAPLRPASGKDHKRFPVPSVHGDQMDQLMKSLKSRLKEDSTTAKHLSNKVSPEDNADDDSLEPQSRDRAHSDPTKQQDEKKEQQFQQTHL